MQVFMAGVGAVADAATGVVEHIHSQQTARAAVKRSLIELALPGAGVIHARSKMPAADKIGAGQLRRILDVVGGDERLELKSIRHDAVNALSHAAEISSDAQGFLRLAIRGNQVEQMRRSLD